MKRAAMALLLPALLGAVTLPAVAQGPTAAQHPAAGKYKNFKVAIYITVYDTMRLSDPATFARDFARVSSQVKFDKVYIESYRDNVFANDAQIDAVKRAFEAKGIETAGGVTLAAGGSGGQFFSFDYEDPKARATAEEGVRRAARHFDTVILDDFFFFNRKTDLDIAAKGNRSWTDYRLARMDQVARDVVIGPAKAENPRVKVIIKFPNWYEHFHGLGFDLDVEPRIFDGIYTGTETRDPEDTDQLLQQYESYEIVRYFENIAPGRNFGGWVDTYSTRYVDRYAEQLWDTMFAKAREMTLFNWSPMAEPRAVEPGTRPWQGQPTSFSWNAFTRGYHRAGAADPGPGWGRAAGYALEQADAVVGWLGKPVGIASYRPYHADGEDFLQNYLGNVGIPIEMVPTFPSGARTVLLTEAAKSDPEIIGRIKKQLRGGGNVVLTSGFVRAMQGKGLEDLLEIEDTGRVAPIRHFLDGFGAGSGRSLDDDNPARPAVLFPQIDFYTNDTWPIIRGVASNKGFPIMLMNRYSNGIIYVLTVPDNPGDLYNLPEPLLNQIRRYVTEGLPVRIDAPPQVALFAYDNDTFIVESFRDAATPVTVTAQGVNLKLEDLGANADVPGHPPAMPPIPAAFRRFAPPPPQVTEFPLTVPAHSFRVLRVMR